MFREVIANTGPGATTLDWIEAASLAIEVLAVVIIVVAIAFASARYLYHAIVPVPGEDQYRTYKRSLGRSLLLGLEVLVAADIVRTVALEATLQSVAVLGLLVVIRTFLSWSLVVEIEGRWPWWPEAGATSQKKPDQAGGRIEPSGASSGQWTVGSDKEL